MSPINRLTDWLLDRAPAELLAVAGTAVLACIGAAFYPGV